MCHPRPFENRMVLQALRALERKYNGPVPREELDRIMGRNPAMRTAKKHLAFWQRELSAAELVDAISGETSARTKTARRNVQTFEDHIAALRAPYLAAAE